MATRRSVFAARGRTRRPDNANEASSRGTTKPGEEDGGVTSSATVTLTGDTDADTGGKRSRTKSE